VPIPNSRLSYLGSTNQKELFFAPYQQLLLFLALKKRQKGINLVIATVEPFPTYNICENKLF